MRKVIFRILTKTWTNIPSTAHASHAQKPYAQPRPIQYALTKNYDLNF